MSFLSGPNAALKHLEATISALEAQMPAVPQTDISNNQGSVGGYGIDNSQITLFNLGDAHHRINATQNNLNAVRNRLNEVSAKQNQILVALRNAGILK